MRGYCSVKIFYSTISDLEGMLPEELLPLLPARFSEEIFLYRKQDDRLRLLAGKLLLRKAITESGFAPSLLEDYRLDDFQRPFIPGFHDFNITHSGHIVACAVGINGRIGIDVEMIRQIRPVQFSKQFSPPEMQQILAAPDPEAKFFDFWTQKEAVMKADGRGMKIPLHSIRLRGDHATIDDREEKWNLLPATLSAGHRAHICSPEIIADVELMEEPFPPGNVIFR